MKRPSEQQITIVVLEFPAYRRLEWSLLFRCERPWQDSLLATASRAEIEGITRVSCELEKGAAPTGDTAVPPAAEGSRLRLNSNSHSLWHLSRPVFCHLNYKGWWVQIKILLILIAVVYSDIVKRSNWIVETVGVYNGQLWCPGTWSKKRKQDCCHNLDHSRLFT